MKRQQLIWMDIRVHPYDSWSGWTRTVVPCEFLIIKVQLVEGEKEVGEHQRVVRAQQHGPSACRICDKDLC